MTTHKTLLTALGLSITLAAPLAAFDYSISDLSDNTADFNLQLDTVVSGSDGVVEIYDYRLGFQGEQLGTSAVYAGANSDVRIPLDTRPIGDVLAVIYDASGNIATERVIEIDQ